MSAGQAAIKQRRLSENAYGFHDLCPFDATFCAEHEDWWGEKGGVRSARRDGSAAFRTPVCGPNRMVRDLESLAMFKLSAYNPLGIAMMGFGVLLVAALAFVF